MLLIACHDRDGIPAGRREAAVCHSLNLFRSRDQWEARPARGVPLIEPLVRQGSKQEKYNEWQKAAFGHLLNLWFMEARPDNIQ
jgi:hypothetical protein